jgi:hypothetical protein
VQASFANVTQRTTRWAKRQLAQSPSGSEESETAHFQGDPTVGLEVSKKPTTVIAQELLKHTDISAAGDSNQHRQTDTRNR